MRPPRRRTPRPPPAPPRPPTRSASCCARRTWTPTRTSPAPWRPPASRTAQPPRSCGPWRGRKIQRAGTLEAELLGTEARRDLASRLSEDLKPSHFLAFLLAEERAQLADLGSEHFERLTDGSYRFTQDDRFDILDVNAAGAVRKADSLSGGETFLASLALALGLAEMVARSGGRLDAFFLDEGFGSLDPEHLDRAMDGIGRLVAEDARRLVVVVSHVAEMREAVEDLIVLDKHPLTGDTVVVSGAVSGARPA